MGRHAYRISISSLARPVWLQSQRHSLKKQIPKFDPLDLLGDLKEIVVSSVRPSYLGGCPRSLADTVRSPH
jgi:hypothetical protein